MTIIVTGPSGVLGSALLDLLRAQTTERIVPVTSAECDLRELDHTVRTFCKNGPRVIYHLAARVSGIMGNIRAQGRAYFDNVSINTNVIEAARVSGVEKIVAVGTTAIYSDAAKRPFEEQDIWHGAPHQSEAGYAHAKRSMLAQLEAYREEYGLPFSYAIATNLYGPNDRFDEVSGHVVPSLISKFASASRNNTKVSVWGSGRPTRDFLYSKDAAHGLALLGEKGAGAYNLATGTSTSIEECAELLADISGYSKELEWDRSKPDGQFERSYNVEKIRSLGFSPQYNFKSGLSETYHWFMNNQSNVRR